MKKLLFGAVIVAAALSSCQGGVPKADLKTDIDTLSYEFGLANTQGLKEYLVGQMGVDTAYIDEFIKGMNEGAQSGDDKKKAAYFAGIQIGQQFSTRMVKGLNIELFGEDSTKTISLKNALAGFIAGVHDKDLAITREQTQKEIQGRIETLKSVQMLAKYGDNKKAGDAFMAKNKTAPGVKTLPSGLQYKVITVGTGEIPTDTTLVQVSYAGRLVDGKEFDSSSKNNAGAPVELRCNQVIKGWTEALTRMPVGSEWELFVPQDLAYGSREYGIVKPFSALIFKLKLVSIKK
ncbi:MAG: FKBP-type peptidyl-prolyl cis-trans isomerase [Bacteroidaceae bacterium]